jgi:hypothetical protein
MSSIRESSDWRNISIFTHSPGIGGILSVTAFHEKAGRSQGNSLSDASSSFFSVKDSAPAE